MKNRERKHSIRKRGMLTLTRVALQHPANTGTKRKIQDFSIAAFAERPKARRRNSMNPRNEHREKKKTPLSWKNAPRKAIIPRPQRIRNNHQKGGSKFMRR
jgi:hypothetical protein